MLSVFKTWRVSLDYTRRVDGNNCVNISNNYGGWSNKADNEI